MDFRQHTWRWLSLTIFASWAFCLTGPLHAASSVDRLDEVRQQALELEKGGQWNKACDLYFQLLKSDHGQQEVKERYLICLRHIHQINRQRDPAYQKAVAGRKFSEALDIYVEVLAKVQASYVEKERVELSLLFRQGLQELRFGLEDKTFVREHLTGADSRKIEAFVQRLDQWPAKIASLDEARKQMQAVAQAALQEFGMNPPVVVFEFICGACNGLDEYRALLTPAQFRDVQAALKGESAGVGIEVDLTDEVLVISRVYPKGPAAAQGIVAGDHLTHIDGKPVAGSTVEAVRARLHGETSTTVELKVISSAEMVSRTVKLSRQHVAVPTVEEAQLLEDGIGYFKIVSFGDSTVQEVRDAVLQLQTQGMKVLILDLRRNPGGQFKAAVRAAHLFLSEGVIAFTHSRLADFNETHKARNADAWTMPLIVLVDNETASAAEVLAGALKENRRATVVGQTTFGKGSIQCVVPLDKMPAGIRITVARFFSPANNPYTGQGVTPNGSMELTDREAQFQAALAEAQQLIMMMRCP